MLILASSSPRRKQLLEQITKNFTTIKSEYEEELKGLSPLDYVLDCAYNKALDIFNRNKESIKKEDIILASDTIVTLNDEILLKPKSRQDAREMLKKLSSNTHKVMTSICIMTKDKTILEYEESEVTFKKFSYKEIDEYIETQSPFDKAGSYGIQDDFILNRLESVKGNIDNIMGLPVKLTAEKLKGVKDDI